jgi:1D-myo-inositol-triphosphate 3-kinase
VQEYKRSYPWVQLAGHEGSFKPGEGGTILKKATSKEKECLTRLMKDVLRPYVPEFFGQIEDKEKGEKYLRMQDLLANFIDPAVMDVKMGVRTYMEDELLKARTKPGYRMDLYEKMVKIDPSAPTEEEHKQKAITKARYMQWRETITTTSRYGYRIEAIKLPGGDKPHIKEFRNMKDPTDVGHWLSVFSGGSSDVQATILARLRDMRMTLETSPFFRKHELIGSSLLFVRDRNEHTGVWMIDFGKTTMVPNNSLLDHRSPWVEGNHEDGYLWGLDNLIYLWECMK